MSERVGGVGCVWQQLLFTACVDGRLLMFCVWHLGQYERGLVMAAAGQTDGETDASFFF